LRKKRTTPTSNRGLHSRPYRAEKYKGAADDWAEFAKKLRRLIGDAIRLWRQKNELSEATYASRRDRLYKRLDAMIATTWEDSHAGCHWFYQCGEMLLCQKTVDQE